jgi:putative membrane protein
VTSEVIPEGNREVNEPAALPPRRWLFPTLVLLCGLSAGWSFAGARDVPVWAFEMLPLSVVMVVFAVRRRWFCFSDLGYVLLVWFFFIQCLGGRYTFAEVPFPRAVMDALALERNPVDRIGHFFQGFVPAVLLREWLIRRRSLPRGWTLFWLVTGCCLAFSASYELLEMAVVRIWYPGAGPEWLGMQGDPWDAQMDMTMALCGAITAQLLLGRLHDRSIARAERNAP